MRVATEADTQQIESVINDPSCRHWMGPGDFPLRVEEGTFADNVVYLVENGREVDGVLFAEHLGIGVFCAMIAMRPCVRGAKAIVETRRSLRHLFANTDCHTAVATVDEQNLDGLRMALACGFVHEYTLNGRHALSLTIDRFGMKDRELIQAGTKVLQDSGIEDFIPEEAGMIGLLKLSDEYANGLKGAMAYNGWAVLAHMPEVIPTDENYSAFMYKRKPLLLQGVYSEV